MGELPVECKDDYRSKHLCLRDVFIHKPTHAPLARLEAIKLQAEKLGGLAEAKQALHLLLKRLKWWSQVFADALGPIEDRMITRREDLVKAIRRAKNALEALNCDDLEQDILSKADVVFCTLSAAGRPSLQDQLSRRRVALAVVDEASQAIEGETMLVMPYFPQRLMLVGDPNQLTAGVVSQGGQRRKWNRSLMQRLFDIGASYTMLTEQHRMAPEISSFPSRQFYHGQLQNSPVVQKAGPTDFAALPNLLAWRSQPHLGRLPRSLVIDSAGVESADTGHAISNRDEADLAISLAKGVLDAFPDIVKEPITPVCILTFYQGQRKHVKHLAHVMMPRSLAAGHLKIHTVDSFQGSEAQVVILSMTRTRALGFLTDFRRINVALTRARRRLLVCANVGQLRALAARSESAEHVMAFLQDHHARDLILHEREIGRIISQARIV